MQNLKASWPVFFRALHQIIKHFFVVSSLISQRIQMKETVADAFISRFQLKPDEVQALKGTRNGPISEVNAEVESSTGNVWFQKISVPLQWKKFDLMPPPPTCLTLIIFLIVIFIPSNH